MSRHIRRAALAFAATAALVLAPASPAFADGPVYAEWTDDSMSIPVAGFPAATIDSDAASRTIPSGASTWLGAESPFGQVFGSSSGLPYMNISTAPGIQPSTTTFEFDGATPSGWGFTVGDIDADKVTISAWDAEGNPVDKSQLGFQAVFNYCNSETSDGPACANPGGHPTWDGDEGSLTGNGQDTHGASGWFQPTVPISRLEFYFESLTGFPIYQLWFAAQAWDISGSVLMEDGSVPPAESTVELVDDEGNVLATTTPDAAGAYMFPDVAAANYTVRVIPPEGYSVVGPEELEADATGGNVTDVDFSLTLTPPPTTTTTTTPPEPTTTLLPAPPDGGGTRAVPPEPSGPTLPRTGTATLIGGLLGVLGLALGGLLLGLSRRDPFWQR